jgi:hypothetical protein
MRRFAAKGGFPTEADLGVMVDDIRVWPTADIPARSTFIPVA